VTDAVLLQEPEPESPSPISISSHHHHRLRRRLLQRFLLSVGLRSFGSAAFLERDPSRDRDSNGEDYTGGTVGCAAGAVDFLVRVPAASSEELVSSTSADNAPLDERCGGGGGIRGGGGGPFLSSFNTYNGPIG
jgi:hypothetical protein